MNYSTLQLDTLETVATEIKKMLGLDYTIRQQNVYIHTIAGEIKLNLTSFSIMHSVYRFIYIYGIKLTKYGIEQRIKEESKI